MKALFDCIDANASQYVSDLQHLLRPSNIHAPNENIFVDDYIQTIKGIGLLMAEYGRRE